MGYLGQLVPNSLLFYLPNEISAEFVTTIDTAISMTGTGA